jgi:dienelactone hydrolase
LCAAQKSTNIPLNLLNQVKLVTSFFYINMTQYLLSFVMTPFRFLIISGLAILACPMPAQSEIIEETVRVPANIQAAAGVVVEHQLVMTIVRDTKQKKSPYIIIHHGRPDSPIRFAVMGQQRYPANANYFVAKGFVVLIPTRIGYGLTGGSDVEYTGECENKNYLRGVAPLVSETKQILSYAEKLSYVDTSRGLVLGESFGGIGAIAMASSELSSVIGVVNISGGDGGSLEHLEKPCRPDQLSDAFTSYGKTNRVPSLWMYSQNDRYWGTRYPKQWFDAFKQAGGKAEFVNLPADKNNGHYIFVRNPEAWHPAFEGFIRQLGF